MRNNRKKTSGGSSRARVKISHPLAVRSQLSYTVPRISIVIQQEQNRRPRHASTSSRHLTQNHTADDENGLQCEHIDDLISLPNIEEPENHEEDVTMHEYQTLDPDDKLKKPPVGLFTRAELFYLFTTHYSLVLVKTGSSTARPTLMS